MFLLPRARRIESASKRLDLSLPNVMSPLKSKSKSERNDKAATDSIDKEEAAIASIDGLPSKRDKLLPRRPDMATSDAEWRKRTSSAEGATGGVSPAVTWKSRKTGPQRRIFRNLD